MSTRIEKQRQEQNLSLASSIEAASSIVTRHYLDQLEQYDIVKPSEEDIDIDIAECGQFYRITKLVINKDEQLLDKLTTIVSVAHAIEGSLASIIRSDGHAVDYYMGIVNKHYRTPNENSVRRREAASRAFQGAIQGNLIGSSMSTLSQDEIESLQRTIFAGKGQAVSSISGIVALRNGSKQELSAYVQGIEHLVDSLRGQAYTILLVADPIRSSELQVVRQGYELLYTQLASYSQSILTLNESEGVSLSQANSEVVTNGIATGIAMTQSKSRTKGVSAFSSVGGGVSFGIPGVPVGFNVNANIGGGTSRSWGETEGESRSRSETEQVSRSSGRTTGTSRGEGRSLQLQYENKTAAALLRKIDKQLERLDFCESFGAFDCAAYVIADDRNAALTVASNYNALMRGEDSSVQGSYINTWHKPADTATLKAYLHSFVHPRFRSQPGMTPEALTVTPASIISGNEMAIQIGLPTKSVTGIPVITMAAFGRNTHAARGERVLRLGRLYHMGQADAADVTLDVQSLAAHAFITGSTGSGKSNTIYQLLAKLEEQNVSFLVVEPAKGEYKHIFGHRPDVRVFGTNAAVSPLLRLNPFAFPKGVHVLEHIDRLIEIFNVCWPLYAAMPAVLKEGVEDAYLACGWDLQDSWNENGDGFFPTFTDVMDSLQKVIARSAYSDELKSNYKGSLLTRVRSLTNGLNGQILCSGELDNGLLFDGNTIVDLSRVGSAETKSLIMGVLIMRLQEHRMTQGGMNLPLRHVTVLEEAHHLLKRTSGEGSVEGANVQGKSVEMLANAIAEMRTFGEGFLIADQAPGMLDPSVIRNTNTKIVLQTPDLNDRMLVGRAANLNDEQIVELAKLATGVAAVYQNNWPEPVLCRMDPHPDRGTVYAYKPPRRDNRAAEQAFVSGMLRLLLREQLSDQTAVDVEKLEKGLRHAAMPTRLRIELGRMLDEYRRTGSAALLDKRQFKRRAAIVSELLDVRDTLEQLRAQGMDKVEAEVVELLALTLSRAAGETDRRLLMFTTECVLRDRVEADENWKSFFIDWKRNSGMEW